MNDLRFGLRLFRRAPHVTLTVTFLLAIGIGATTALFALFDAVLLRPLPVQRPKELVRIVQHYPRIGPRSIFPRAYYEALRDHSTMLAGVFATATRSGYFSMTEPLPAEQITVDLVTPEYFDVLGIQALYGRLLSGKGANPAGTMPLVLSYRFWQRRFQADPNVLGQTIVIQGTPFTVAGILPGEFNGITADQAPDVRAPLAALPLLTHRRPDEGPGIEEVSNITGRLKAGVTREQVLQECLALYRSIARSEMPERAALGIDLEPIERGISILRDRSGAVLKLLMGAATILLLLVAVNIAGLLLVRTTARQQEITVRLAIGATRMRLVRQLIVECIPLAVLGTAVGLVLANLALPLASRALPPVRDTAANLLELSIHAHIDGRVLGSSLAGGVFALFLFASSPALFASRSNLDRALRAARPTATTRGHRVLVSLQIALCTLLLATAGLFVRTFQKLRDVDPGFDSSHIATFTLDVSGHGYTSSAKRVFLQKLVDNVAAIPDVVAAGVALRGVMRDRGLTGNVALEGQPIAAFLNTNANMVSPGYFDTMGMHFLAGRGLLDSDASPVGPNAPTNAVVNEAFAKYFFDGAGPLGKRFGLGPPGTVARGQFVIVGVVSNTKYRSLREPIMPLYFLRDIRLDPVVLNVRTRGVPQSIFRPVREALTSLDPSLAFLEVHTMKEEVNASTAGERLTAGIALMFGMLSGLIAGVGLYALLAYAVERRRREIGIRMALGAKPVDIALLLIRQSFTLTASGTLIGLGAALFTGRWARALIYGVSANDPLSMILAVAFAFFITIAATVAPVHRAASRNPGSAIQTEG